MVSTVVEITNDRLILSVSAASREALHLRQGDKVEVDITPQQGRRRRSFQPGQLLREHQEIMHELPQERAWIGATPVGREIL